MTNKNTAYLLIGFQNDYFTDEGILRAVVEESTTAGRTLENTLSLLNAVVATDALIISTPIVFTPDYRELDSPIGILKTVKDVGAFKAGTPGCETVAQLKQLGSRILEIPGKTGLNAFSNTNLDKVLRENHIQNVVLAGVITSVCIDSTARSAAERGYRVTVLSDCTAGRSNFEQKFYCEDIFPIYANVCTQAQWLAQYGKQEATFTSVVAAGA